LGNQREKKEKKLQQAIESQKKDKEQNHLKKNKSQTP
jgi:hypothetical protein